MGRMIDIDALFDYFGNDAINETTRSNIEYFISEKGTVEAIPKADYENRLKADLVAMLTGLSMEIGEIEDGYTEFDEENKRSLTMIPLESVERLIDGKINSLKEDTWAK